jgi:hypothetical protein
MVVGMMVGPDRIPNLDIAKAFERPGVYAFPDVATTVVRRTDAAQHAGSQALAHQEAGLAFQEDPQPTIYYPPGLAADRLGGQMFSAPPKMPPEQAAIHAAEVALHRHVMAGLTGAGIPETGVAPPLPGQMPEAIAA